MNALQYCQRLKYYIHEKELINATVHSVFNRACNIITTDDELITILSYDKSMAPMSVQVKLHGFFTKTGVIQGMKVTIYSKRIIFDGIDVQINLDKAKLWDPTPSYPFLKIPQTEIQDRLKIMEQYILSHGKPEGMTALLFKMGAYIEELSNFKNSLPHKNGIEDFILNRFIRFINLVKENDVENISQGASQIIGFGPGLTPSSDDFITGLMASLLYMGDYFNLSKLKLERLNHEITKDIKNKTTRISEKMLLFANVGEVTESVRTLLELILSATSKEAFIESILDVISFGETSGTDILCGVYTGIKLMLNEKCRRLYEYENQY